MQVDSAVQSHLLLLSGIGLPTSLSWHVRREEPSRGSSGTSRPADFHADLLGRMGTISIPGDERPGDGRLDLPLRPDDTDAMTRAHAAAKAFEEALEEAIEDRSLPEDAPEL